MSENNFKNYVSFFKECLNEKTLTLIFMPDRMILGKKEELNEKIKDSCLNSDAYEKAESQIVNILGMLLEEQNVEKIISVVKEEFKVDNEEQIKRNIEYVKDSILDKELKQQYILFTKSKSNKLLNYNYEINRKIISGKEIKTSQICLSILKPYNDFSKTDIDEIVFDLTLNDLENLIEFLNNIKKEMEIL